MGNRPRPPFWTALLLIVAVAPAPAEDRPAEDARIPNRHDRPIIEKDGHRLLWAGEDAEGNPQWFDMTGSTIDPHRFQFGIGKDTIPSIDEPEFVRFGDPRLGRGGSRARRPCWGWRSTASPGPIR